MPGGVGRLRRQHHATGGLPKKPYKFAFVCHVTLDQFFTPTVYGIQDACAAFGSSYQWTGSQKNVVSEMVSAMQTAIAEKVDGIAVCLVDPKAFDAPTAAATAAGIPVIAFNADVPVGSPNKRLSYVGQPLYQSGYNSALKWLKLVPKGGHVMLSIGVPGSLNTQPRLDGYIQAIKDAGTGVTYDVVNTGPDPATEISRVESYYLSHKDVAGMFGTGGSDTYACGFIANKYGLAKKGVAVAGFDLFPQTLDFIKIGRRRVHDRPAGLSARLLAGAAALSVQAFGRPGRPGQQRHQPSLCDQGQCRRLCRQDPLRGPQRRAADLRPLETTRVRWRRPAGRRHLQTARLRQIVRPGQGSNEGERDFVD